MQQAYQSTGDLLFDYRTCADWMGKLRREFDRFRHATSAEDRTDHAMNFAITAWALVDWVASTQCRTNDRAVLQDAVNRVRGEFLQGCSHYAIMKDIANASKHRQIMNYAPTTNTAHTSAVDMPAGITSGVMNNGTAVVSPRHEPGLYVTKQMLKHNVSTPQGKGTFQHAAELVLLFLNTNSQKYGLG